MDGDGRGWTRMDTANTDGHGEHGRTRRTRTDTANTDGRGWTRRTRTDIICGESSRLAHVHQAQAGAEDLLDARFQARVFWFDKRGVVVD